MGRKRNTPPPPPVKKAPPPVAEEVAGVVAPTARQEAARRARRGAYTTRGQKMGAGGQVLGASPVQLADVATASGIYQNPDEKKMTIDEFRTLRRMGRGKRGRRTRSKIYEMATRKRDYDEYLKARKSRIAARKERAETARTQGGMTI